MGMATEEHRPPEHIPGTHHTIWDYSPSTRDAQWIGSPDEHESHPGRSLATRSHEVIKRWAEARNAVPATIEGTEHEGRPGVLRFDFLGWDQSPRDSKLRHISWDEWFRSFDERELVFIFQEHTKSGRMSNFYHLDSPEREHD